MCVMYGRDMYYIKLYYFLQTLACKKKKKDNFFQHLNAERGRRDTQDHESSSSVEN